MNDKDYVGYIWHFKVEDDMEWDFCAGILHQDGASDISAKELKKTFNRYFKENMGIEPYSECPICGKQLLPRESRYGYFIGCSGFPECRFMATNKKPYVMEENKNV